jgi:glycosyltransferase involved in cell wall biosynthesis
MTQITDRLDDQALRLVDAIQVENPWMFDYAQRINAGRNVDLRYAPPGVDARAFHPLHLRNLTLDPYILCVGRFNDPRKNVRLLLEAYAAMLESLRDRVRLVLAGASGPDVAFWKSAVSLGVKDRVSYVERPSRQALIALYQQATVFALPSDEEGLGVALLEAMACGIPVVSTRSGGPDGIITDGVDGFLVPLDDAQTMSDRLVRLCSDEALNQSMGLSARWTVEHRYAEEVAAQVFLEMWDRLAAKGKGQR